MHIEMTQNVWWVQSLMKVRMGCYISRMTYMHMQYSRSYSYRLFGFELSILRFEGHDLFDEFFENG